VSVSSLGLSFCGGKVGASKVCLASPCTVAAHRIKATVFAEAREARADQLYLIQAASGETKAYGEG
jgi:hypothetical protein